MKIIEYLDSIDPLLNNVIVLRFKSPNCSYFYNFIGCNFVPTLGPVLNYLTLEPPYTIVVDQIWRTSLPVPIRTQVKHEHLSDAHLLAAVHVASHNSYNIVGIFTLYYRILIIFNRVKPLVWPLAYVALTMTGLKK